MKFLLNLQRIMAFVTFIIGLFFLFSETPLSEGFSAQVWTTVGGLAIVLLSVLWTWLIDKEEGYFIHETSKKIVP